MKRTKRLFAAMLILALVLQLMPAAALGFSTAELTDHSFNGEGVWITEIYHNDVDRSEENNTRDTNGYLPVDLFASASDLMEFIEICSTHDADIQFNELYELYIDGTLMNVTDMNGSSDITLTKGQPVVIWNYRTDVVMPTEAQLRSALWIPDNALVLQVNYGSNWPAESGTFAIRSKATGSDISAFTAVRDTHTKDGMSVELKMPYFKDSAMEVYRAMNLPSAGRVYAAQLNGLITAAIPEGFDGKGVYITEIRPNDIKRSGTYGTESDLMECLEITNTTDQDVDLNTQYRLCYTIKEGFRKPLTLYKYSSSAAGHIGSSSGCIVPAGSTVTLWCYRESHLTDATSFPTLSQFRSAYGLTSSNKVYIFKDQNGLTNENRALELFRLESDGSLAEPVSTFCYQGAPDCANDLSAQLKINPEGPAMLLQAGNATSTIGSVDPTQLEYIIDDGSAMELRLYDGQQIPEYVMQGQDLRVYFYYHNPGDLTRVSSNTYYRFDGTGDWIQATEGGIRVANRYETVIPAYELFDKSYVEFYVNTCNEYRTTSMGIYRVNVKKINDIDGIRTNISPNEEVRGTVAITANDGTVSNSATKIYIDGVKQTVTPMLEDGAYYTFVVDGIDSYFRTAITTTSNELITHIGKWAFESLKCQVRHIDSSYFTYKSDSDTWQVKLRFWAGTYGFSATDTLFPDANREDFTVTNLKLKLANGKEYLPSKVGPSTYNGVDTSANTNLSTAFDAVHSIGDSSGKCPYMNVTFNIPSSEVTAVGIDLDTTSLSEGPHTLKVTNGTDSQILTFIVDNTAPAVDMGISEGESLKGNITLNPGITEANSINEFVTCLDGEPIALPFKTTAYALGAGDHTLTVYARDAAGNETNVTRKFVVEDTGLAFTDAGSREVSHSSAQLYLSAQSDSQANATFYRAERLTADAIDTVTVPGASPYLKYELNAPNAQPGDDIVVNWTGSASGVDSKHKITMFVHNTATGGWDQVATADAAGAIENASFPAENHLTDGKATVIVQRVAEQAMPDLDPGTDGIKNANADWDGNSVPKDYDFSFAWISDTQIYVQRYQTRFLKMNQWIVDNAEALKIKYVMHTGDIVDDWDAIYQWENADTAMKILEDAGIQYGVLPGNHDIASGLDLRNNFYTYFGEDRVKDQYVFGESYENNYGHYDLVSENGQDFLIVYMGWNINEPEINWMNEVLAKHSDRKAILCFHPYTHVRESVDGLLDYWGVMVQNHVVSKNPNVFAVLNGHYSGATYQTVRFDDNGDGKLDRTVYQICTDYQSLDKGGLEYVKFLYFDLDSDKVYINSYSRYMDDFNYFDTAAPDKVGTLAKNSSTGVVSNTDIDALILDLNFDVPAGTITESSFSAAVYTDEALGTTELSSESGQGSAQITGLSPETRYQWYAVVENTDTGYLRTDVYEFTTEAPQDFYLFGYINGADYACEADAANLGQYKFSEDGQLEVLFTQDSYIGVKAGNNTDWYMTQNYETGTEATLYKTTTGASEKMLIPAYQRIQFTLTDNLDGTLSLRYTAVDCDHEFDTITNAPTCTEEGSRVSTCKICTYSTTEPIAATGHSYKTVTVNATCDTDGSITHTCTGCGDVQTDVISALGHSFADGVCTVCGEADPDYVPPVVQPTLSLKYPTLTFEDVITMNVFFSAENLGDVVEMGLITYKSEVSEWNVDNAEAVVPGYIWDPSAGFYCASTLGIPAKEMGDTYWFAVYAKLSDGSYTYTRLVSYSPTTYAYNQLSDPYMSKLVVAMLNYGAAAQTYFGYRTDSLMNAGLTADQLASIEAYRADMMDSISTPGTQKAANFTKTATGFTKRYPTITFEGAFSIDYFCQPSFTPVGDITLYYWNQDAYDAADVLTVDNASGALTLEKNGDLYGTSVEGIAAKDLDKGVYVTFVYSDGANTYCSGILGYSIGLYCQGLAAGTDAMAPFAAATAVYGYYAKQMFY